MNPSVPRPGAGRSHIEDLESYLLSPEELSVLLGIPVATVYRWRSHGGGPAGFRIGKHLRYRFEDVEHWLDLRRTS